MISALLRLGGGHAVPLDGEIIGATGVAGSNSASTNYRCASEAIARVMGGIVPKRWRQLFIAEPDPDWNSAGRGDDGHWRS